MAIVKDRIRHTRYELDTNARSLYNCHLFLSAVLSPIDWEWVDMTTAAHQRAHLSNTSAKQARKFERLAATQKSVSSHEMARTVINLSDKNLDEGAISALNKGLNFAPTPRTIPIVDFISGVEQAVRHLPQEDADEVRLTTSSILASAKPPKSNISRAERESLHALQRDEDLVVLPADKGNATVVINATEYHDKIKSLLEDSTYKCLKRDPTLSYSKKTSELLKNSGLPEDEVKNLKVRAPRPPRLYGLPKVHKEGVPLRPIVSAISSPTYKLAKYLTKLMFPIVGRNEHHIKNSQMFIEKIKQIRVGPNDILVSLDVVSLFTKVPVEDTLKLLSEHFPPETINLFRLVMTTTYFLYGGKFYEMTDGMAMGSPLSPAMANFFMEHFEERALNSASLRPSVFFRYVDDIFMVWPHSLESLKHFVEHMNGIHSNIQFTVEMEKEGRLPFLDVLVHRKSDGRLGHSVYRKPTHTDLYLSAESFHHPVQKRAVLNTLIHRAKTISDEDHLDSEIHHLKYVFRKNGYSPHDIKTAFAKKRKRENVEDSLDGQPTAILPFFGATSSKIGRVLRRKGIKSIFRPPKKIKEMLRPVKDSLGLRIPGIYNIPCECGSNYIGQSIRTIADRCTEHQRHIKNRELEKSAVAEHSLVNKHRILFNETKVLAQASTYWDSVIKEAVEIRMCVDNFNRDNGYNLSGAWKRALDLEKRQRHSVQQPRYYGSGSTTNTHIDTICDSIT